MNNNISDVSNLRRFNIISDVYIEESSGSQTIYSIEREQNDPSGKYISYDDMRRYVFQMTTMNQFLKDKISELETSLRQKRICELSLENAIAFNKVQKCLTSAILQMEGYK